MEPVEWEQQFADNYAALKASYSTVVAKNNPGLMRLWQSLMQQAQGIQYALDNHLYMSDQLSDAVDNWFSQVRSFAGRIGTVQPSPIDVSPPDTNVISQPFASGENYLVNRMPSDLSTLESEVERILIWGVGLLAAWLIVPPLIDVVRGRR